MPAPIMPPSYKFEVAPITKHLELLTDFGADVVVSGPMFCAIARSRSAFRAAFLQAFGIM